jgi:hypothetical protein
MLHAFAFLAAKEITDKAKIWWNGYTPESRAASLDFALHDRPNGFHPDFDFPGRSGEWDRDL